MKEKDNIKKNNKTTFIDVILAIVAMVGFIATMFAFNIGGIKDISTMSVRASGLEDKMELANELACEFELELDDITISDNGKVALLQCKSKLSYVNTIAKAMENVRYSIIPVSDDACFSVVIRLEE